MKCQKKVGTPTLETEIKDTSSSKGTDISVKAEFIDSKIQSVYLYFGDGSYVNLPIEHMEFIADSLLEIIKTCGNGGKNV